MNENENKNTESTEDSTKKYLDIINELKQNTVSKQKSEKILEENRQLLSNIVNGVENTKKEEKKVDLNSLRKTLISPNSTDLEIVKSALELRKEIMKNGGRDPFLPHSNVYQAVNFDKERSEQVANIFEKCIEIADGNNSVFINELSRITADSPIPLRRK